MIFVQNLIAVELSYFEFNQASENVLDISFLQRQQIRAYVMVGNLVKLKLQFRTISPNTKKKGICCLMGAEAGKNLVAM